MPAVRPAALLRLAQEPVRDLVVNAVQPILRMMLLLLQMLHLLLQFFGAILRRPQLHRELMRCLSSALKIRLSGFGGSLQQRDNCRTGLIDHVVACHTHDTYPHNATKDQRGDECLRLRREIVM